MTELAIGDPRFAFYVRAERQRIDEDWAAGDKLNVVSAGIAQHHPAFDRPSLQVERQEGGRFLESSSHKPASPIAEDLVCQFGSPDDVLERINGYVELGTRTVIIRFAAPDQLEQLEICSKEILPRL